MPTNLGYMLRYGEEKKYPSPPVRTFSPGLVLVICIKPQTASRNKTDEISKFNFFMYWEEKIKKSISTLKDQFLPIQL